MLAPIPTANVRRATAVNRGDRIRLRRTCQSWTLTHRTRITSRLMWSFQKPWIDKARAYSFEGYYVSPAVEVLRIFAGEVAPCFPAEDTQPAQKRAKYDPSEQSAITETGDPFVIR